MDIGIADRYSSLPSAAAMDEVGTEARDLIQQQQQRQRPPSHHGAGAECAAGAADAPLPAPQQQQQPLQEDIGYETAKLKGIDVLGQVAVMLRQRGMRIVRVMDVDLGGDSGGDPMAAPMACPPDADGALEAERWMQRTLGRASASVLLRACGAAVAAVSAGAGGRASEAAKARGEAGGGRAAGVGSILPALVARTFADQAPEHTAERLHLQRGLARDGDRTEVYLLPTGKIRIKQLRLVRDAIADDPPARVIVASREKIPPTSEVAFRELDTARPPIIERFLLRELSYNLTRHYLVPAHRLCSPDEIAALRRTFPKLALQSREDAVTRFYGLLPGDVIVYHRRRAVGLGGDYYREVC